MVCGVALSWRLWTSSARLYPTVPVSDALPRVPYPLDHLWLCALVALLAAILVSARPRPFVAAFLALAGCLCLFDQSRWQPWFYQYYFMLAALWFYDRGRGDEGAREDESARDGDRRAEEGRASALDACRLIVVATYFWSGAQKLNYNFFAAGVPALVRPYVNRAHALTYVLTPAGFIVPLAEILIAAGLLTRRFRRAAVVAALATHALVLLLFVPVGNNSVVWPWNVAMAAFVLILFRDDGDTSAKRVVFGRRVGFHTVALALFGVMPLLGLLGLWDSYLSAALYSYNTAQANIHLGGSLPARLPETLRRAAQPAPDGGATLNVTRWSFAELNVPAYPEGRVFRRAAQRVCDYAENPSDAVLEIRGRPNLLDGTRKVKTIACQ